MPKSNKKTKDEKINPAQPTTKTTKKDPPIGSGVNGPVIKR